MKIIEGNLLYLGMNGTFNVIIHGCNCQHIMGAGIAYEIRNRFPEVYGADRKYTIKGDRNKLGRIWCVPAKKYPSLIIINAYTQFNIGKNACDYNAIRSCFKEVKKIFGGTINDYKIGYPKIGAGLAGGNWDRISKIIDEELEGMDHTLVIYKK